MDPRKMKSFTAMLVAGVAAAATTLTGCGGPEPSTSSTTTSSIAPATSAIPSEINVNDPTELASTLNTLGVETPATAPITTDRAGAAEGIVFPTWPAGDVRKEGLSTFRLDATVDYKDDGVLKFMKGSKVLFETPFAPKDVKTQAKLPQDVINALRTGDEVTWGIFFASKSQKPVTASFKVLDKPQVAKAEAKLAGEMAPGVVRELAKAQILKNYRLHSEAVTIYSSIVDKDPKITAAFTAMADSLQTLKMKNTPLYDTARNNMPTGVPPRLRVSTGAGGGVASTGGKGPSSAPAAGKFAPPVTPPSTPATPPATPSPAPDDSGVAGPANPLPPALTPGGPGGLPTSPPGGLPTSPPGGLPTSPPGGPIAVPTVPGTPPAGPTHPTPPGPTHPTPPGPTHPTPPGPTHPTPPGPIHPATPPPGGLPPVTPPSGDPVPVPVPGPGGVLPEAPPGGVLPETPPGGVLPETPPPGEQPVPNPNPDPNNPQ